MLAVIKLGGHLRKGAQARMPVPLAWQDAGLREDPTRRKDPTPKTLGGVNPPLQVPRNGEG
jgi:hypothetical protein